jgi:hypothetical protein
MRQNSPQIYCINTRDQTESRHLSIFRTLDDLEVNHTCLIPTSSISKSAIGKRLARRHYLWPHILALLDSSSILFSLLSQLLLKYISRSSHKKYPVLICFNSWYFYPYAYLLSYLPNLRLVVDLGYPFDDVSTTGLPFKFKRIIQILERPLLSRPLSILLESPEQVSRLSNIYPKPCFFVHYVLSSSGLSADNLLPYPNEPFADSNQCQFILFRGTLNPESGIKEIVSDFIHFKKQFPSSSLKLFVFGRGEYSSYVSESIELTKSIVYNDKFLDRDALTRLILSSQAMIGQFGTQEARLRYTIPHKYIESIRLRKLYVSPFSPPIQNYYRNLLDENELHQLQISDRPFLFWLSLLNDMNRLPSNETITTTSTLIENQLRLDNQLSLAMSIK